MQKINKDIMEDRYITAIDLGTAKLAVTVAKVDGDDIQIIYYKETPSDGIRNSFIFNPVRVSAKLKGAIMEAENELDLKITQAVVGLPRYYVRQETAKANMDRNDGNSSITKEEIESMKEMALESYPLDDKNREVIYGTVAQSFSTEDYFQQIENDIIGMPSDYLEGDFKIFIGTRRPTTNIDTVFNETGLAIAKKYFTPDIDARAILCSDEMENGVAVVDFGAGVTSVTIYQGRIMRHFAAIPFGGQVITNDIKTECSINEKLAENIKLAYGVCMPDKLQSLSEKIIQIDKEEKMTQIPVKYLSEIITSRVKEIVEAILYEIQISGYADKLGNGIVLTGGCANLTNCANYIKELSGYNVRIGYPRHLFSASGCNGVYETEAVASIGMILAAKTDKCLNCVTSGVGVKSSCQETDIASIKTTIVKEKGTSSSSGVKEGEKPLVVSEKNENREKDEQENEDGTLINPKEFGPKVQKPKSPKKKLKWTVFKKISNIGKQVGDSMGNLYDGMKNESI
jgi:cell division protein FtsA